MSEADVARLPEKTVTTTGDLQIAVSKKRRRLDSLMEIIGHCPRSVKYEASTLVQPGKVSRETEPR